MASKTGWRTGKEAMQIVPSRTFLVCVATAASMVIASRRGLWIKLSPNQTDSNTPDCSATMAVSISSSTSVRPNSAPRLGRLMPHFTGSFACCFPVHC